MKISMEEWLFLDTQPGATSLYEALRQAIKHVEPDAVIEVKKTQISFKNPLLFAAVSFLPVLKKAARPDPFITLTLGLFHPLESPRVSVQTEPYTNRWTVHIILGSTTEIDDELLSWIAEAAACARMKKKKARTS